MPILEVADSLSIFFLKLGHQTDITALNLVSFVELFTVFTARICMFAVTFCFLSSVSLIFSGEKKKKIKFRYSLFHFHAQEHILSLLFYVKGPK